MAAAIVLVSLLVVLVLAAAVYFGLRRGEVRTSEFKRLTAERNVLAALVDTIELKVDQFSDIDSVLAATVRGIIRAHRAQKRNTT